jgi:hypothetical protein
MMGKLGASNVAQLIQVAAAAGLIDPIRNDKSRTESSS